MKRQVVPHMLPAPSHARTTLKSMLCHLTLHRKLLGRVLLGNLGIGLHHDGQRLCKLGHARELLPSRSTAYNCNMQARFCARLPLHPSVPPLQRPNLQLLLHHLPASAGAIYCLAIRLCSTRCSNASAHKYQQPFPKHQQLTTRQQVAARCS
jgi:hypothetical protein